MLLIYVTLAWLAGIVLAEACAGKGWLPCGRVDAALLAAVVAGVGALVFALRKQGQHATIALLLAAFLLGGWRYSASPLQPCLGSSDLASYHQLQGQYATVEGVIDAYPDGRAFNTRYRLRVERLLLHDRAYDVRGVALVQAERRPLYPYGARVRFQGVLETPPVLDDFDYRAYLARQGIHTIVRRAEGELLGTGEGQPLLRTLYGLRERSEAAFARALPQPLSGVARAMFLGSGGAVPLDVADAFRGEWNVAPARDLGQQHRPAVVDADGAAATPRRAPLGAGPGCRPGTGLRPAHRAGQRHAARRDHGAAGGAGILGGARALFAGNARSHGARDDRVEPAGDG